MPFSFSCRMVVRLSTVFLAKRLTDLVTIRFRRLQPVNGHSLHVKVCVHGSSFEFLRLTIRGFIPYILKYQKELNQMWVTEQYIKLPPLA